LPDQDDDGPNLGSIPSVGKLVLLAKEPVLWCLCIMFAKGACKRAGTIGLQ